MNKTDKKIPAAIKELIDGLGSKEPEAHARARQALVSMRDAAIPYLAVALKDRRQEVRWEAAKAMGEINSEDAIPALVEALVDRDFDVRWLAAEALISLGTSVAAPLLQALVEHPESADFREGAHHILGHLSGSDAAAEHHATTHPKSALLLAEVLVPVMKALGQTASVDEVRVAAKMALEAMSRGSN